MATYDELARKILSWSNRDTEVLSYSDIKDFLNYGVDNAYRELRVAPMEALRTYTISNPSSGQHKLTIPSDLIEIIQLRKQNMSGNNSDNPSTEYDVFEAKADVLSFYDEYLNQYGRCYFTRERNTLLVSPSFKDSEVYELYYYRRLPELDARFDVNTDTETTSTQYFNATRDGLISDVQDSERSTVFTTDPDLDGIIDEQTDGFRLGKLTGNWLRDNNEKVVLYGALMQAGMFLGDAELEQRFTQRFLAEVESLNREDNMRRVTGGHIQTRFTAYGLI